MRRPTSSVEREIKLRAGPHFSLPALAVRGLTEVAVPEQQLVARYYDTASMRLARWDITARFRAARSAPDDGEWTLKLPECRSGDEIVRHEVTVPGDGGAVPTKLENLVVGVTRGEPLVLAATITTLRRAVRLVDALGDVVIDVDDDDVIVASASEAMGATAFREVEVEVGDVAKPSDVAAVVKRLEDAGAERALATPKLYRALAAPIEPEIQVPTVGRDATIGELIVAATRRHVRRFVMHLPAVMLGEDPEAVHQARVALRRLRSDLRTFEKWMPRDEVTALRGTLRDPAATLGAVRDDDVLLAALRGDAADLSRPDAAAARRLISRLQRQRRTHLAALTAKFASPDFVALVRRLVDFSLAPPLLDEAAAKASDAARAAVRRPWKRLRATVEGLDADSLHLVRIAAKRARYAAEAVTPVDKRGRALARRLAELQEMLGAVQDGAVAAEWLRGQSQKLAPTDAFVAGRLASVAERRASDAGAHWRNQWERVEAAARHL